MNRSNWSQRKELHPSSNRPTSNQAVSASTIEQTDSRAKEAVSTRGIAQTHSRGSRGGGCWARWRKRREREFFIDNLLVRIHLIIVMIRWTGLAPREFKFPFPGSLTCTFLWCKRMFVFRPVCSEVSKSRGRKRTSSTGITRGGETYLIKLLSPDQVLLPVHASSGGRAVGAVSYERGTPCSLTSCIHAPSRLFFRFAPLLAGAQGGAASPTLP